MENQPIIVLITAPSRDVAGQIARTLVEKKLAACVNIVAPITSIFRWEGEVQDDEEALLIVKSRSGVFQDHLVPAVLEIHPYDLPEIIALPVGLGLQGYLDWIQAETGL